MLAAACYPNVMSPKLRISSACSIAFTLTLASLTLGCTAAAKETAIEAALQNPETRRESFEATLRALDENPEYVDELFALTLRHPKTLERFTMNTAAASDRELLATLTARHLARHPNSLRLVMVRTLEAALAHPEARAAVAAAMRERAAAAAEMTTDDGGAVRATLLEMLPRIAEKKEAREAFVKAMQEQREVVAKLLVDNPKTLRAVMAAVLEVGADAAKDELTALLAGE